MIKPFRISNSFGCWAEGAKVTAQTAAHNSEHFLLRVRRLMTVTMSDHSHLVQSRDAARIRSYPSRTAQDALCESCLETVSQLRTPTIALKPSSHTQNVT